MATPRSPLTPPPAVAGGKQRPGPPPKASLEAALIAEHARQVGALLPGGLAVAGVYAFVAGGLPAAVDGLASAWADAGSPRPGLLLGVDAASRKLTLREVEGGGGAPRPAEARYGAVRPHLVQLEAPYPLAARAPAASVGPPLADALLSAAAAEGRRAAASVACARGAAVGGERAVADAGLPAGPGGVLRLELLPPAACAEEEDAVGDAASDAAGSVRLGGWVVARAVAHARDAVADAVAALAADVAATVTARARAAVADAEDGAGAASLLAPPATTPTALALARRALFPLAGDLLAGELAPPGGSIDDDVAAAADAAEQLLGRAGGVGGGGVVFSEAPSDGGRGAAAHPGPKAPAASAARARAPAAATATPAAATGPPAAAVAAALVALAAVLAALLLSRLTANPTPQPPVAPE